jgi:hypothetical protein
MTGSTYILEGQESQLAQHSGHEVEVTGSLAAGSGSAPGSSSTTSGSSASSTTGSGARSSMGERINVTSVRMISSTCSSR